MNCPTCNQEITPDNPPTYDSERRMVFYRGSSVNLSLTQGAIFERLLLAWPHTVRNSDLHKIWGIMEVDAKSNLGVQMCNLRKKVKPIGITINNIYSGSIYERGGYWLAYE